MKKILFSLVLFTSILGAQKLGHVDVEKIFGQLPETKRVENELKKLSEELQKELEQLGAEYQKKVQEFQKLQQSGNSLQTILQTKAQDIEQLQQRIQEFQVNGERDLQSKQTELSKPILDKVKKAVEDYGKSNGYTYIFISQSILYGSGDDLTETILGKLKSTSSAARPAGTNPAPRPATATPAGAMKK